MHNLRRPNVISGGELNQSVADALSFKQQTFPQSTHMEIFW